MIGLDISTTSFSCGPLDLHYQPIVATPTQRVVAFEALLRVFRGTGWTSARPVIAAAERAGMMPELGRHVLDQAMREFGFLSSACPGADAAISVNVSPGELDGERYVTAAERTAQRHGVPLDRMWLAVTGTSPIVDIGAVAETLEGLRELGATTCIDDFGAGWTTVERVRALPVDIVTIDRGVLKSGFAMGRDPSSRGLSSFEQVTETLYGMGVETLAEGVEDEAMHQRVVRSGCTFSQGWLHGCPRPAAIAFTRAIGAPHT